LIENQSANTQTTLADWLGPVIESKRKSKNDYVALRKRIDKAMDVSSAADQRC